MQHNFVAESLPPSFPRCQQASTSIPHCQNSRSRYSQTNRHQVKAKFRVLKPTVCVQLKKFSGWLLRNFKIASLGERAAFTYKYSFSCKESAFSGLSWKVPSKWDHPNHHMGFSKHTNMRPDGDSKCWFRPSGEGQDPV